MSSKFMFTPHVNTPLSWGTLLLLPMTYAEGGRMRWEAIYIGFFVCALSCSAIQYDVYANRKKRGAEFGMASGIAFGTLSQYSWLYPIQRFITKRASAAVGAGYFSYHAGKWLQEHFSSDFDRLVDDE